jgi:hypothetical protein
MLFVSSPDEAPPDDELTVLASDARAGNAAAFDLLARRVVDRLRGWSKTMSLRSLARVATRATIDDRHHSFLGPPRAKESTDAGCNTC